GLRLLFGGAPDLEVVGEVDDGSQVCAAVARLRPDVVLMDIRMPVLDGIEATRAVTAAAGRPPAVVVLTTFDGEATVVDAVRAGAAGYLLKHTAPEELVAAVRRAAAGDPVLSPAAARSLIAHAAGGSAGPRSRAARQRLA